LRVSSLTDETAPRTSRVVTINVTPLIMTRRSSRIALDGPDDRHLRTNPLVAATRIREPTSS